MQQQFVQNQVIMTANPGPSQQQIEKNKKQIRALAITEAIIGTICFILGLIVIIHVNSISFDVNSWSYWYYFYYYRPNYLNAGEGLWGGFLLILAGILGIACSKSSTSPCLVNCHMAFSIVAAVSCGCMLPAAILTTLAYDFQVYPLGAGIEITLVVLSFIGMGLTIASASLCCCAPPINVGSYECCATCCATYQHQDIPMYPGSAPPHHQNVVPTHPIAIQEDQAEKKPGETGEQKNEEAINMAYSGEEDKKS